MFDDSTRLSIAVVEAVAEETNTAELRLPEPLHEVIDPEALDRLFADRSTDGCVRFQYCGYKVTAYSDGTVEVDPLPVSADTS